MVVAVICFSWRILQQRHFGGDLSWQYISHLNTVVPRKVLFSPNLWFNKKCSMLCKVYFPHSFASPLSFPSNFSLPPFLPIFSSSVSERLFRDLSISSACGHSSSDRMRTAKCVKPGSHCTQQRFSSENHSTLNEWRKQVIRKMMVF